MHSIALWSRRLEEWRGATSVCATQSHYESDFISASTLIGIRDKTYLSLLLSAKPRHLSQTCQLSAMCSCRGRQHTRLDSTLDVSVKITYQNHRVAGESSTTFKPTLVDFRVVQATTTYPYKATTTYPQLQRSRTVTTVDDGGNCVISQTSDFCHGWSAYCFRKYTVYAIT